MEKDDIQITFDEVVDYSAELMEKHFPKGECKERGKALVFNAKLLNFVWDKMNEAIAIDRINNLREDTYKDLVETFGHLKKDDLVNKSFILAIIKEELSKLRQ